MHVLRKLSFAIGLATVMATQHAMALGLGAAEVKSALNQPLQADIRLTSVEDMTADDLIVRLASVSAFENAGVTRLEFYDQLNFQLMLDHESGPLVRVTTREPVREPYLNFLVEARWASGRLMREYTLLLDLPIFEEDRAQAPVQTAPRESAATRPSARPQQRQQTAPAPRADSPSATPSTTTRSTASGSADSYGPVGANDTLWEIALQVRPGRDLSVQQTMLAIQRANPDAFINGNINLLRRGQVLRIPSRADIQSTGQAQAVRQVAQQNRDWSEARGVQLDAGRRVASQPREAGEVTGQVTLASATGAAERGAGQSGGDSETRGRELQGQLDATLEELDKTRSENRELSARVRDLESQIDTMESLIQASNEQLRALQLAAEQNRQQAAEGTEQPAPDFMRDLLEGDETEAELAQEEQPLAEGDQPQEEPSTEQTVVEEEPEVTTAPVVRDTTRVVRSAPPPPSFMDRVMENLLAIIGGLLVVILAAVYFIQRRKQAAVEREDDFNDDFDEDDFLAAEPDHAEFPEEDDEFEAALNAEEDAAAGEDFAAEDTASAEAETGDVVSEAEIYIAYGKPEQAEEMLLNGLANEPGSVPILGKLLEVYAETQNVEAFDQHYAELLTTGDEAAIQRAADLRESIPGAGEFNAQAVAREEHIAPVADDLSLGSLELDGDLAIADSDDDELTFDEDLSFDLEDDEPTPPETTEKDVQAASSRYDLSFDELSDAEDEDELTFDLDLEDLADDTDATGTNKAEEELQADLGADLTLDSDESTLELDEDAFELDEGAFELGTEMELEPVPASEPQVESEPEPEAEAETPAVQTDVESEADEEISFDLDSVEPAEDFDSLDSDLASLDDLLDEQAAPPELALDDDEDFDPNLDVSGIDLDALDKEMGALDEVEAPEAPAEPEPAGTEADEAPFDLEEMDTAAEPASDDEMDAELDFLADADEVATKLDLARAYIDMGDTEGAKDILSEVSQEGNDEQKREAAELLARIE